MPLNRGRNRTGSGNPIMLKETKRHFPKMKVGLEECKMGHQMVNIARKKNYQS